MKEKFTALNVLRKARELIKSGHKMEPAYTTCQQFCPWCACAEAKTQLDNKYGTGVSLSECFKQVMSNQVELLPGDEPLEEARIALKPFTDAYESSLTQKESVAILQKAEKLLIN